MQTRLITVCRQRQGAEKRDQVNFYLTRGRGNIYPTDDYIIEHVMLANSLAGRDVTATRAAVSFSPAENDPTK